MDYKIKYHESIAKQNKQQLSDEKKATSSKLAKDQMYNGPLGLKRDYDALYKALEKETFDRLGRIETGSEKYQQEINFYKNENQKVQQQFGKVIGDNKALYLRCKDLEAYLLETNPSFQGQYQSIIQENEQLKRQNEELQYGTGIGSFGGGYESQFGTNSSNRLQQLQKDLEDLKKENYELQLRFQAQLQEKGIPYSRSQIEQSNQFRDYQQSFYRHSPRKIQTHDNYCDSIISSNELHNRAVLERCKSIVAAHNYY